MLSMIEPQGEHSQMDGIPKVNGFDSTTPAPEQSTVKGCHSIQVPSYPTNSLNFMKSVKSEPTLVSPAKDLPAIVRLRVLVVGAGLGGLATAIALARRGHTVEVLEQAPQLGEVGAGIQIPSNSSRILAGWGLEPFMKDNVVEPDAITFRRWANGDAIGLTKLIPDFRTKYKAPYYVVHRAHFHNAMYQLALSLGITVKVGHKVVDYDESVPSVTLSDGGGTLEADLVVAADGIKSIAAKLIPGYGEVGPTQTGFAAYRATVDVSKLRDDPDVSWLLEKPALNIWIGPDCHVMTYTIAAGRSFNMVLSHIDRTDPATWRQEAAVSEMRSYFENWDPRLVKIIHMIDKTMKWPLMTVQSRNRWLSRSKKLLILGDAAHAMVPYMSQGAAMAVEDGAALAEALSHATSADDLPRVLGVFERVRAQRAGQMQQASLINGTLWHFSDGPEQEARDLAMQPEVLGQPFEESPNQWSDPVTQEWAYGYDAVEAIAAELGSSAGAGLTKL